jgi:Flp pilus assembly protein TadD
VHVISIDRARERFHLQFEDDARVAFIERDFDEALRKSELAIRFRPSCFQSHVLRGDVLCALGQETQALWCYHRARRLAPSKSEPLWSISTVHSLAGRWHDALRYLERAQAKLRRGDGPLYEWIAEDRAVALMALGRLTEARRAVAWGLKRRPKGERLRELKAQIEAAGRYHLRPLPTLQQKRQPEPN